MFREPHQFVQRVVDDEQALAVEDNPHIAAAGAGYFLLCKTAVFDAAGHIVRLKEQAVAEKITGKESIALICCAKHVAKRDAVSGAGWWKRYISPSGTRPAGFTKAFESICKTYISPVFLFCGPNRLPSVVHLVCVGCDGVFFIR